MVKVDRLTGQVAVENKSALSGEKEKVFTFDTVFGADTKQVDIYNETARPIVESVLEGYNGMFVYLLVSLATPLCGDLMYQIY